MSLIGSLKHIARRRSTVKNARALPEKGSAQVWADSLAQVDTLLDGLITATEADFLTVAENLQEYYSRAQNMCGKSDEVVQIMTGDGLKSATDGLNAILDDLKAHIAESQGHFSQMSRVFQQHRSELAKISSSIESFRVHVLSLNMLGFLTRVENAHIFSMNTGFATLTDDVRNLSEIIKQKSIGINTISENVQSFITLALGKISHFERIQSESARITLEKAIANHNALSAKVRRASESARLVDQISNDIASSIGDIVISMQFHDITRQQLEHVKEVLDHLCAKIGEKGLSELERTALVRDILQLQNAQLGQSHEELATAVFKVIASLQTIAVHVGDVVLETQEVAWASDAQGQSFMEGIDSGISSLIDCIRAIAEEHAKLSETVTSASEMVSEVKTFVNDIESLGMNLQLIALNSRIKAAHLGQEGAMLDTISSSIYELSKNAREDTSVLSAVLENLVELSMGFKQEILSMQGRQAETIGLLVERLKTLIASLRSINGTLHAVLGEMKDLCESLLTDIQDTADEITVHKKVEHVLEKVMRIIGETHENARRICPYGMEAVARAFLKNIDRLYTTKSERDIHLRHMASAPGERDSGDTEAGDGNWENLELF